MFYQKKIYLAAPLFSLAEVRFNAELSSLVSNKLHIGYEKHKNKYEFILPQDFGIDPNSPNFFKESFLKCRSAVSESDLVLAILDGSDTDSGTATEIGYAHGLDIPVIGVRTDFRQLETQGVNLMIAGMCKKIISVDSISDPHTMLGLSTVISGIISDTLAVSETA